MNRFREYILALTDTGNARRFSHTAWVALSILMLIMFLPTLFFPLGPDEGLFFVSGQKILQGAVHYRDIVDVKPPMIYYLYATAIALFGDNAISIRILDIILQSLTCMGIILLVRKASGNDIWAAVAAISYVMLYSALNYNNTAQTESYLGLFAMGIFGLQMFWRTKKAFFLIGLLVGFLFFFKFTFGIMLALAALAEFILFERNWKRLPGTYVLMALGFGIMFGLFVLYLIVNDAYTGFQNMQLFINGYVALDWGSKGDVFRNMTKNIPMFYADNYSLFFLLMTVTGMWASLRTRSRSSSESGTIGDTTPSLNLLRLCTLAFILLVVTIGIEGKGIAYQFSRVYVFGAILGGYGIVRLLHFMISGGMQGRYAWFMGVFLVIVIAVFSPLTRYVWHSGSTAVMLLHGAKGFDEYYAYSHGDDEWTIQDLKTVGNFVKSRLGPGDKLFTISGVGGLLYYYSGYVPDFGIYHSCFLIADFAPQAWRDSTSAFMLREQPRIIVLHKSDRMIRITGTLKTSNILARELRGVNDLLNNRYNLVMETPAFEVYERKNN